MDKMRMESVDMTAQNIEKIGALFPNCITETVDENGKAKKVTVFTYKPKKSSKRKMGHRQPYSQVRIEAINA